MAQFEINPGFFFDTHPDTGGAKSEFQMVDNSSSLPACLTQFTQPAAFTKNDLDGGAFHVLKGEKITLLTSKKQTEKVE